jgi:hypothetical protein
VRHVVDSTSRRLSTGYKQKAKSILNRVGFEPTPFRTSDSDIYPEDITLSWRLRPLGHLSIESG